MEHGDDLAMSLTDQLHRKSDPTRAFLDVRQDGVGTAKEKWHVAQSSMPLAKQINDWTWDIMAIDQRIRLTLAHARFSAPNNRLYDVLATAFLVVLREFEDIQSFQEIGIEMARSL
ncbi:MAG: hypothetical protein ACYCPT_11780 [Acidimicrobiales bacterium]